MGTMENLIDLKIFDYDRRVREPLSKEQAEKLDRLFMSTCPKCGSDLKDHDINPLDETTLIEIKTFGCGYSFETIIADGRGVVLAQKNLETCKK